MLSDEVASKVLGELHVLTKQIDEQSKHLAAAIVTTKQAADQIKTNSAEAVNHAKDAALHAQIESAARFEIKLTNLIAKSMDKVTIACATKAVMRWIAFGVTMATLLIVIVGIASHSSGLSAGRTEGYSKAMDEKAAASWANTTEGKLAYALAQGGDIGMLFKCSGKGWVVEGEICYAKPVFTKAGEAVYGWNIGKMQFNNKTVIQQ